VCPCGGFSNIGHDGFPSRTLPQSIERELCVGYNITRPPVNFAPLGRERLSMCHGLRRQPFGRGTFMLAFDQYAGLS
jgi:hypothetical protein